MIYLLIFRLWLDNCYTNSLWINNKSFLLYSELAYILHTESNDQKNHYALNWRGKRGLNFNRDIWTNRNFGADFFFFFGVVVVVMDKFGGDHIFEIHLILSQYNIANRKNFGTKTLLLGWTRSNKLGDHQKTRTKKKS